MSVRVPSTEAEPARALLLELAPGGFEEREDGEEVELAAYCDAEGAARIGAAFPNASAVDVEPGWEDRWREFHRPVRAGGLWIGPPWVVAPADEAAVVIDPGRAFGTGAHPTTRACVELLAGLERGSVLDAGCGSGVVSVAAAKLGFGPVFAVDNDPVAVETAMRAAFENGVEVTATVADVLADQLPQADLVVANIELRVVERLLARRPGPVAVTSGYLVDERPAAPDWASVARVELEGWAADVLRASA